ncbi:MAG: XdhC family protein, partial [Candidatus Zixiibacteriota bacterium]
MTETSDIFKEINCKIAAGKPFVLATIVQTAGSSPRRPGARMLVYPDGSIYGTIGGGKFEKLVIDDGVGLLNGNQETRLKIYKFTGEGSDSTGMSCGGEAKVFMEKYGKPKRLVIFGGGHVGRDLVKVAKDLDFSITVVDDRKDILESYDPGIKTVLTD